jgi:hypothetical protein
MTAIEIACRNCVAQPGEQCKNGYGLGDGFVLSPGEFHHEREDDAAYWTNPHEEASPELSKAIKQVVEDELF